MYSYNRRPGSPERIVRRFLASQVKILVDVLGTLEARKRFPSYDQGVIATFESGLHLYRIFDGAELARILKTGKITGGTYSVKAERAHGASWGENITAVIEWGNTIRDKRLGGDLFLAKLDATGKKFYHLDPGIGPIDPSVRTQDAMMDRAKISTGLGASIMDVDLHDVDLFVVHPNHRIEPLSIDEAKAYVEKRPKKDVDLQQVHGQLFQGTIFGVDVRVLQDKGTWKVVTNDDRIIASGSPSKEDAIELAQMAIHMRPERPIPMTHDILEQKRRYQKHFEPDEDPEKVRGNYALKPKDRVKVTKGSNALGIKSGIQAVVADVYQRKGERTVLVKLMIGSHPVTLYATHPNRLGDEEVALMNSKGDRILIRR